MTAQLSHRGLEPLAFDLSRVDHLLRPQLERCGIEWPRADQAPPPARSPKDYALPGMRRAIAAFGLAPFDCDVLLFALAPEIDDRYAAAFGALHRNTTLVRPSVGLLVRMLAEARGIPLTAAAAALAPGSRLFEHGLLKLLGDGPHATRLVAAPTVVWQQLLDDQPRISLSADPQRLADLVHEPLTLARARAALAHPTLLVAVHGPYGRTALALALAAELGRSALVLDAASVADRSRLGDALRDAQWWGATIVLEHGCDVAAIVDVKRRATGTVIAVVDTTQLRDLVAACDASVVPLEIEELGEPLRTALWQRSAGELSPDDHAALAARYRFGPSQVESLVSLARSQARAAGRPLVCADVSDACHTSATTSGLAHRVVSRATPDDLVVTGTTRRELDLVEAAARHAHRAFAPGGAGSRIHNAGGFVALFSGAPGTGKTLSAQLLARRLDRVMLRVDLSRVVNKYIGETEKHLDKVFHDAESTGALLFFDEADAVFGKRTEVKDAHDRYANLETSYLLQRLETHRGITILASNFKQNFDPAFLRRIQFNVDFAMPTRDERRAIWERHLEPTQLDPEIDLAFLATFTLSGGDIRNAAICAALLATDEARTISMVDLVIGTWREIHKAGHLIQAHEFGPYRDAVIRYARIDQ